MANLTNEQIEQKKLQLKRLSTEIKALCDELVVAGAIELSEEDLVDIAGGGKHSWNIHVPQLNL